MSRSTGAQCPEDRSLAVTCNIDRGNKKKLRPALQQRDRQALRFTSEEEVGNEVLSGSYIAIAM